MTLLEKVVVNFCLNMFYDRLLSSTADMTVPRGGPINRKLLCPVKISILHN